MNENERVIKNMKIRQNIDQKWVLSLFIKLYKSTYY